MSRIKLNALIDLLLIIFLITSIFSGIVLWQILPSGQGYRGGRGELLETYFLGFSRHYWVDIHNYLSWIFVFLMLIHLLLHYDYLKNLFKIIQVPN